MSTENAKFPKKVRRQGFSMERWDDEVQARRFIPHNLKLLQQRAKDDGRKTRFIKPKLNENTGFTTIGIELGNEQVVITKDGIQKRKIIFDDTDYIKVHYDRSRKLPQGRKKKEA